MKNYIIFFCTLLMSIMVHAVQTTYTFYNASWGAKVGTYAAGSDDGWTSQKDGKDYATGGVAASGIPYGKGVHITTTVSGAGATSVMSFTSVRKIIVNYAVGSSAKGTISIKIGDNEEVEQSLVIAEGGIKDLNHDIEFDYPTPQSGKITFTVKCTKNPIYINSITIKAQNGSPYITGLTMDSYQLVTDISQIKDGDEVIFGVVKTSQNYKYIMGLYDEWNSRNNIYAISGAYSDDRSTVNYKEEAVYTVHIGKSDIGNYYAFSDIDGYWLVANGGNPTNGSNNRLAIWDTIYSTSYGWYGAWTMQIADNGAATITCLGKSASKVICFNYNSGTPIFACYKPEALQTAVALYRRTVIEDPTAPYMKVPYMNMGTVLMKDGVAAGSHLFEINAVNLNDEIQCTLKHGTTFTLDKTELDRDGDKLTISYDIDEMGYYTDTLTLTSGSLTMQTPILLNVTKEMTIAEAKQLRQLDDCWLQKVTITKKYDKYIFVADETGDMLLFDGGNLYGKDRKNGDVLTGVMGKYKNYYGNPSITLGGSFSSKNTGSYPAQVMTSMPDSADACRFVKFEKVKYNNNLNLIVAGEELQIYDMFGEQARQKTIINQTSQYDVEGIVYYYNGVVLCPAKIEYANSSTDIEQVQNDWLMTDAEILNPRHIMLRLFSANGTLVGQTDSDINLRTLPAGVYLLFDGSKVVKFENK